MDVTIKINCGNAAFEDQESSEVARILRELVRRIDGHPDFLPGHSQPLRDINGNTVGSFDITE